MKSNILKRPKRKVIFKNCDVEVVEITWPPGSATPFHNHGASHGIGRVLAGSLQEHCMYSEKGASVVTYAEYKKGGVFRESPKLIHCVWNPSKTKPARSVHVYTPLLRMKEFTEEELKRRRNTQ